MKPSLEQTFFRKLMLVGMVSVILLSMLTYYAASRLVLSDMRNKGDVIGRMLSVVATDALLNNDYATLEGIVQEIGRDPYVVSVSVTRADGEVFSASGTAAGVSTHDMTYPIFLGEDILATVKLHFSKRRLNRITRIILYTAVLAVILLHVIGLVGNRMVLQRTVILPLQQLRNAISAVSMENLDQRILMDGPFEFREIASAFNAMADRLKKNITELHGQSNNLAAEERKLAAIVASIADGLFVTDEAGVILSFNPSAERITGYGRDEALGQKCASLFQTSFCLDACALSHEQEFLSGIETTIKTKDGTVLTVAVSSAVLYDDRRQRCGGVQTFRDITEEKQRLDDFCRTEKMVAIGQLVAGVTHEINNPLANILGYAKLLRPNDTPALIEARREVIIEQAEKCKHIVKELLDYSRTSGTNPRILNINALIQRLVVIMDLQLNKKGVNLILELADVPFIEADIRKIEQLFLNLLLNAIQAVEQGGTVVVRTWLENNMILATIEDDGPGIPTKLRTRVFDPFFTTKPVGQGTGLGLAICESIVAEMNGHLESGDSHLGGAHFTMRLPITPKKRRA